MSKGKKHADLRQRLIGLGERSIKKSYYPELQKRMLELERFRHVLDRASDAIFLAEAGTGLIADANTTAAALTGLSKSELPTRSLHELFSEELPLDKSGNVSFKTRLRTVQGGTVPVEIDLWLQTFSTHEYLVCMARDITEREKAEAEREQLISELERKNIELERFLYTASHDLKTPLTTVKGFTGLLAEDIESGDREAVVKDLERINQAMDQMLLLLNDVLELSRIGRIERGRERVGLEEVVVQAVERVAAQLGQPDVRVRIDPGLPVVEGDRERLLELLENLVENAIKFSPGPQPEVVVQTRRREDGTPVVCVSDRGEGIDPRYHENVFGLFNQLDPSRPGTGVGLTIAKRVVELHGGTIWVESEGLGGGCSLCFTLGTIAD